MFDKQNTGYLKPGSIHNVIKDIGEIPKSDVDYIMNLAKSDNEGNVEIADFVKRLVRILLINKGIPDDSFSTPEEKSENRLLNFEQP